MKCAIMQPTYLPWAGYFDLIDRADVFILDDLSQYVPKSWHSRNRIRTRDGQVIWLTVPVHGHRKPLNEIEIAAGGWWKKHLRTLEAAYGHAPYWDALAPDLWPLNCEWTALSRLTGMFIRTIAAHLGITTRIVEASTLTRTRTGRLERIQDMCAIVGADTLVNTAGAKPMFDGQTFGIPVEWVEYQPARYQQAGQEWRSHLSVIDAIAHNGPNSLNVIRGTVVSAS